MNMEKYLANQSLPSYALNFDPTQKDLIRITDPDGHPMGKYIPVPSGASVDRNGTVHFVFRAPGAHSVAVQGLGGAFSERIPLYRQENGDWTGTAEGLPAGFHYHDYIVDGTRMCNDLAPIGYGDFRAINYFEIPDADSGFYLLQDVPHGTVRMDYYNSTVTARYRSCFVYTPPGYETHPEKHYPVLYLQHGGGETETGWIWQGKVNYIMDNLIAAGQCQEMILVMNDGYAFLPDASEHPAGGAIDLVLAKDCIPFIDQKYRTLPDRRTRAVAGLSMGGFQAQAAALHFPELFASAGLFSCYFIIKDHYDDYTELFSDARTFNGLFDLFFFSTGTEESNFYEQNLRTVQHLKELGIDITYFETPGYHDWQVWRHSFRAFVTKLFRPFSSCNSFE